MKRIALGGGIVFVVAAGTALGHLESKLSYPPSEIASEAPVIQNKKWYVAGKHSNKDSISEVVALVQLDSDDIVSNPDAVYLIAPVGRYAAGDTLNAVPKGTRVKGFY